ncbi:MAG TPA: hypothetical protein VKT78_20755, partial [Fimbriimonadaceae bacterium]|nr:hypothetical protein [Fimbriimonadaceae bacterium]
LENAFTLTDILQTLAAIAPGAGLGLDVHLSGEGADPRLGSLFGALWILRCYASAAEFGLSLLTVASTSDMRHPALAALARTLTGRDRFHAGRTALSAEQVVLHAESGAILVGNLLRSSQALPASFELVHHRTLSPTGWRDGAGPLREMGPYEVVLLG